MRWFTMVWDGIGYYGMGWYEMVWDCMRKYEDGMVLGWYRMV